MQRQNPKLNSTKTTLKSPTTTQTTLLTSLRGFATKKTTPTTKAAATKSTSTPQAKVTKATKTTEAKTKSPPTTSTTKTKANSKSNDDVKVTAAKSTKSTTTKAKLVVDPMPTSSSKATTTTAKSTTKTTKGRKGDIIIPTIQDVVVKGVKNGRIQPPTAAPSIDLQDLSDLANGKGKKSSSALKITKTTTTKRDIKKEPIIPTLSEIELDAETDFDDVEAVIGGKRKPPSIIQHILNDEEQTRFDTMLNSLPQITDSSGINALNLPPLRAKKATTATKTPTKTTKTTPTTKSTVNSDVKATSKTKADTTAAKTTIKAKGKKAAKVQVEEEQIDDDGDDDDDEDEAIAPVVVKKRGRPAKNSTTTTTTTTTTKTVSKPTKAPTPTSTTTKGKKVVEKVVPTTMTKNTTKIKTLQGEKNKSKKNTTIIEDVEDVFQNDDESDNIDMMLTETEVELPLTPTTTRSTTTTPTAREKAKAKAKLLSQQSQLEEELDLNFDPELYTYNYKNDSDIYKQFHLPRPVSYIPSLPGEPDYNEEHEIRREQLIQGVIDDLVNVEQEYGRLQLIQQKTNDEIARLEQVEGQFISLLLIFISQHLRPQLLEAILVQLPVDDSEMTLSLLHQIFTDILTNAIDEIRHGEYADHFQDLNEQHAALSQKSTNMRQLKSPQQHQQMQHQKHRHDMYDNYTDAEEVEDYNQRKALTKSKLLSKVQHQRHNPSIIHDDDNDDYTDDHNDDYNDDHSDQLSLNDTDEEETLEIWDEVMHLEDQLKRTRKALREQRRQNEQLLQQQQQHGLPPTSTNSSMMRKTNNEQINKTLDKISSLSKGSSGQLNTKRHNIINTTTTNKNNNTTPIKSTSPISPPRSSSSSISNLPHLPASAHQHYNNNETNNNSMKHKGMSSLSSPSSSPPRSPTNFNPEQFDSSNNTGLANSLQSFLQESQGILPQQMLKSSQDGHPFDNYDPFESVYKPTNGDPPYPPPELNSQQVKLLALRQFHDQLMLFKTSLAQPGLHFPMFFMAQGQLHQNRDEEKVHHQRKREIMLSNLDREIERIDSYYTLNQELLAIKHQEQELIKQRQQQLLLSQHINSNVVVNNILDTHPGLVHHHAAADVQHKHEFDGENTQYSRQLKKQISNVDNVDGEDNNIIQPTDLSQTHDSIFTLDNDPTVTPNNELTPTTTTATTPTPTPTPTSTTTSTEPNSTNIDSTSTLPTGESTESDSKATHILDELENIKRLQQLQYDHAKKHISVSSSTLNPQHQLQSTDFTPIHTSTTTHHRLVQHHEHHHPTSNTDQSTITDIQLPHDATVESSLTQQEQSQQPQEQQQEQQQVVNTIIDFQQQQEQQQQEQQQPTSSSSSTPTPTTHKFSENIPKSPQISPDDQIKYQNAQVKTRYERYKQSYLNELRQHQQATLLKRSKHLDVINKIKARGKAIEPVNTNPSFVPNPKYDIDLATLPPVITFDAHPNPNDVTMVTNINANQTVAPTTTNIATNNDTAIESSSTAESPTSTESTTESPTSTESTTESPNESSNTTSNDQTTSESTVSTTLESPQSTESTETTVQPTMESTTIDIDSTSKLVNDETLQRPTVDVVTNNEQSNGNGEKH